MPFKVNVIEGDIAKVEADALITAINSGGMWFGGIDGVIMRLAGGAFHNQATAAAPLSHGQVVVAKGRPGLHTPFKNVIFVVDDLTGPLQEIIFKGLCAASDAGFRRVTLPTIRMGVMLGVVEKSLDETIGQMKEAVHRLFRIFPIVDIEEISFVVYDEPAVAERLRKEFADINKFKESI